MPYRIIVQNNPVNYIDPLGLWRWHGNWGGPDWTGGQEGTCGGVAGSGFGLLNLDERFLHQYFPFFEFAIFF